MIWARPLGNTDAAHALWVRSSLTPQGVGLLRSGQEAQALVTGLDEDRRELLAELIGAGWVGGSGDAAIIRYSPMLVDAWVTRLGPQSELAIALRRLVGAETTLAPMRLGDKTFSWGSRTHVMGIVNVTPDSFSDGGKFVDAGAAIEHGLKLVAAGADLIDVGGESTRPGAADVSEEDELRRVIPVVEGLRAKGATLSIDTRKAKVARAAIEAGAVLVNDVGGLQDDAMLEVVATAGVAACATHMQGAPQSMQTEPRYDDVVGEILDALELALRRAESRGIPRSRLLVDPGIGFGKTLGHNLFLLHRASDLRLLGAAVLWGVSRKGFLGTLTGKVAAERVAASTAAAAVLASAGAVDVIRVHDVGETRDALAVADAIRLARDGGAKFGS